MAKDPAVLFYTQDFLVGTLTMTDEQRGKYIYLLCLQHQKGKLTLSDLKSKLNEEDIEVANRFPLQADGFYYNERMYQEAIKRKNYTESRRNNRKKKDDIDVQLLKQSYVNRMENENVNEDVNDNINNNVNRNEVLAKVISETMKIKPKQSEINELDNLV
jgi:ATP-dependent RNA circularization protein (DNA/RNA ligase family)